MATYIRWYIADEDMWCYAERDETRWVLRHVEQRERDDVFFAAASLAEELHARDSEGLHALIAYHHTYGWTPELPIDDFTPDDVAEHRFKEITAADFEQIWQKARRAREADWGVRAVGKGSETVVSSDDRVGKGHPHLPQIMRARGASGSRCVADVGLGGEGGPSWREATQRYFVRRGRS